MQPNDLYDEYELLLGWVNREQSELHENQQYDSIQQVSQSNFISQMLLTIDEVYFVQLRKKQPPKQGYFQLMKGYLEKIQGKRLRRSFRMRMQEQQPVIGLIKLLLFLCVKSSIKEESVSRILQLSEQSQTYLMNELQQIDANIDSIQDISEVLHKIQELQQDNDQLRDKFKQLQEQQNLVKMAYRECKQNQKKLLEDCKKFEDEKISISSQLGITNMKDYTELFQEMMAQFKQIKNNMQQLQHQNRILETEHKQFVGKVAKDSQVISSLTDEIKQYRTACYGMREQISLLSESFKDNNEQMLRQQTLLQNNKIRTSLETNITFSSFLNCLEDDEHQNEIIRMHNNEIVNKLQMTYKKITQLTMEISQLKQQNFILQKNNKFSLNKLNKLRELHTVFAEEYDNFYH